MRQGPPMEFILSGKIYVGLHSRSMTDEVEMTAIMAFDFYPENFRWKTAG